MKGNLQEGLELLNQAETIFRERNESVWFGFDTWFDGLLSIAFLGDYQAALQDADEAIELTESSR